MEQGYANRIAQAFHERYERLAPDHGYETREASAVPWEEVPEKNRSLMVAVVESLVEDGVIQPVLDEPEGEAPARDPLDELLAKHTTGGGRGRSKPVRTVVLLTITEDNSVAAVDQRSADD